ncbi:bacterio-opsin activator domain-containing protein [Natronoglomus mannanivorans]|uniref:Helix-turn-helix domain-containing protein n=1 Tax=Natronoglomus mannanivorans TaxID=2979990 RepID=A0AAP3E410_9EURY|nr:helix-turn-helix domain-containing protein [Halobacteria archaeon AArc-xg1-1]
MAIEASFTTTSDDFPLAEVFSKFPAGKIELDRVVPTNDFISPYFWLEGADEVEINMEGIEHPGISDLHVVDDVGGEVLVRIDWDFEYESVLSAVLETDIELRSAVGKEDKWTFEVRAEDQEGISDFHDYCQDNHIPMELTQLHALSPLHSQKEYDLTDTQREALTLLYARGYFDSPREATQEEVADELGITRQALASRLQRGMRRLIASTVIDSPE